MPTSGMNRGSRSAFTLVELLLVIAIVGLLVGLLTVGLTKALNTAKKAASEQSTKALVQAVEQFRSEFGFLPPLVHDGVVISGSDPAYQPAANLAQSQSDGPTIDIGVSDSRPDIALVWSEGVDRNFLRRRTGMGLDEIDLPSGGGPWDNDSAWDDRRYSKFSLAYYLGGVLGKGIDGLEGPGFARPLADGSFEGVGYPVGSTRDRYEPTMDVDRRGVRIQVGYGELSEFPEHDQVAPAALMPGDTEIALVDSFGHAYRYYRWEHGRFYPGSGKFEVRNALDMNIPPVLIDPVIFADVRNNSSNADETDLTQGSLELRSARFAVVGAGPDGLFGVEAIETIADALREPVPTDLEDIAKMRKRVWEDNAVGVGN
ncbi:MAG: type II secretion system protein [Phycisphaerales bacterium]|nr:type II secretion system protein [Phycisphaerales bacterium]